MSEQDISLLSPYGRCSGNSVLHIESPSAVGFNPHASIFAAKLNEKRKSIQNAAHTREIDFVASASWAQSESYWPTAASILFKRCHAHRSCLARPGMFSLLVWTARMERNALARALSSSGLVSGDRRRMKMAVAAASTRDGSFLGSNSRIAS